MKLTKIVSVSFAAEIRGITPQMEIAHQTREFSKIDSIIEIARGDTRKFLVQGEAA